MRACSDLRVLCSLVSRVVVSSGGEPCGGIPKIRRHGITLAGSERERLRINRFPPSLGPVLASLSRPTHVRECVHREQ